MKQIGKNIAVGLHMRMGECGLALVFCLTGCSALLPKSETTTQTPWASFDEARQVIDNIVPYQTKETDLNQSGLDPYTHPNIAILTYADVLRRFVPTASIEVNSLALGIRECIAAREACKAYEVTQQVMKRKRYGNFWSDIFNFRRKTEITGWRFNAVVVMINGLAVYKLWGGQPMINEYEESSNPLGPLQGSGESAARSALHL